MGFIDFLFIYFFSWNDCKNWYFEDSPWSMQVVEGLSSKYAISRTHGLRTVLNLYLIQSDTSGTVPELSLIWRPIIRELCQKIKLWKKKFFFHDSYIFTVNMLHIQANKFATKLFLIAIEILKGINFFAVAKKKVIIFNQRHFIFFSKLQQQFRK